MARPWGSTGGRPGRWVRLAGIDKGCKNNNSRKKKFFFSSTCIVFINCTTYSTAVTVQQHSPSIHVLTQPLDRAVSHPFFSLVHVLQARRRPSPDRLPRVWNHRALAESKKCIAGCVVGPAHGPSACDILVRTSAKLVGPPCASAIFVWALTVIGQTMWDPVAHMADCIRICLSPSGT